MPDNLVPESEELKKDPLAPAEEQQPEKAEEEPLDEKIAADLKKRVDASKRNRKQLYNEWKRNVELRIGKIATQFTGGVGVEDEVQTEINPDWSLTKTKTANLFSQVPTIQGTHENKQFAAAIGPFMKSLNYEIGEKRANIGTAMEEEMNDAVNASGFGAIFVSYAARFEDVDVPAIDTAMLPPKLVQQLVEAKQIPTTKAKRVTSYRFCTDRVSPTDSLWPAEFTGSDFDHADWVGHSGRCSKAVGQVEFELSPEQLEKATSGSDMETREDLRSMPDKGGLVDSKGIRYDEIFYWRYRQDAEERYFQSIWRIVWIDGIDKPVIHEAWKGQKVDEQRKALIGAKRFPMQFVTLTYITDNPIPPSDSSAGRPQVNDMRRSRSQMFQNRERSIPIRGFDVNRIDPLVAESLMKGTWQQMIPINGNGQNAIWEVARASYPSEDFSFDQAAKSDLLELWQLSPQQLGQMAQGRKTSAEVNAQQAGIGTNMGRERNRVAKQFLNICDVVAGLMVLYSDFPNLTDQERQAMMQAWDMKHMVHELVLKLRPDSTVVLDSGQRLQKLTQFLNIAGKSGFVNPMPILVEMAELSGLDPADVIVQPKPKPPEEPNMSYRFTGKDDLQNVAVMAMLVKHNQAPGPQDMEAAKKILMSAQQPPAPEGAGAAGAPGAVPPGAGGVPAEPGKDTRPDWSLMSKIAKRSRDVSGG